MTPELKFKLLCINADLPPGIKATIVGDNVRYTVRTSIKGRKFSLGTFIDLSAAIQALAEFKVKKTYAIPAVRIASEVEDLIAMKQAEKENKLEALIVKESCKSVFQVQFELLKRHVDMHGSHLLDAPNGQPRRIMIDGEFHLFMPDVIEAVYDTIWGGFDFDAPPEDNDNQQE